MSVRTKLLKALQKQWGRFLSGRDDVRTAVPSPEPRLGPAHEAERPARAQPSGERRPRRRSEQTLQRAVLELLELWAVPNCYWFHVGNGGYRTPTEARVFKSLGVRPGVPDLILIRDGRTYGLELKADGGRLTPVQRTAHVLMRAAGAEVVTVGLDAAFRQLECWGMLRGRGT